MLIVYNFESTHETINLIVLDRYGEMTKAKALKRLLTE